MHKEHAIGEVRDLYYGCRDFMLRYSRKYQKHACCKGYDINSTERPSDLKFRRNKCYPGSAWT